MCMQPTVEHHKLMKKEKKRYKEQGSSLGDLFKVSQTDTKGVAQQSTKMYSMLCNKHGKKEEYKRKVTG